MNLSCCIIDDEPLALALLENYVNKTPFLLLTGKFSSAISAMESVRTNPPDVLFLDIQMAELNGMEFARLISKKTRIVFTTAFEQYALESYKVNALDYLLKPFSYPEFLRAANKVLQWHQLSINTNEVHEKSRKEYIFVKAEYRLVQVELKNILYIEGLKDYLKIYIENELKPIITHITMRAIEEMLPGDVFIRVHRSFIVNCDKIKIIERNRIVFGKTHIPVSDTYKDNFQQYIEKRML